MMLESIASLKMGVPSCVSASRMSCSRMLRVKSSPVLASSTTKGVCVITSERTCESVT